MKNSIYFKVLCLGLLSLLVNSCKKNKENTHYSVYMTDAPGNFSAVNIDIQGVEVTGEGSNTVMLNTNARIYNLLNFSNGKDTLIASGDLDVGAVSQVRLILGTNNTVRVDGVNYPLSTPSAMQSGLKIQVHSNFEPGVAYGILLDFDANQSIVLEGNGEYQLKPTIRAIDVALNGSIRGQISPLGILVNVTATSTTDSKSYSSVPNAQGEFLIAGLAAGVYSLTVYPDLPFFPVTISNVIVTTGNSANVGVIAL